MARSANKQSIPLTIRNFALWGKANVVPRSKSLSPIEVFRSCQADEIFDKTYGNRGLNPREALLPTSFSPRSDVAVAELINRENRKVVL
jgi:hypothetical protein